MRKYDEINNPTSCLNKASLDEPLFVLRAQDSLAPFIVRSWAMFAKLLGTHDGKVESALLLARDMEEWQSQRKRKTPD